MPTINVSSEHEDFGVDNCAGLSDSENQKLQSKLPPLVLHGNLETNDEETFTEEDNDGFLPTITSLNDNDLDVIFSRSNNGGLSAKKKYMDSSPNIDQTYREGKTIITFIKRIKR